ncbi:MAG: 5-methyltetrahydropteroyltriglutamate--homocysteine methyltransferase [SAR86 cluster bacterium]|uniref:5-methyltetrahydropteroyltriglutamate--homocysteine methyltransferase n=1 Tax=SAR86 cluster bacterium TaxID=2030880 RepID=A0A2A5CFS4_9GAMM|nr:MAG: 5-methyltetrahydropteroyltriglutamate--homocysteine methyltransferase [SAR86 cluster bacterium]
MTVIKTALVGSYAQPEWLIDREALRHRLPARIIGNDMWRVEPDRLEEAMNDAVLSVLKDQEVAGLDIVTDGEVRRESYSAPFANAPEGIDRNRVETLIGRAGLPNKVPLISGPLKRVASVHVDDVKFLRANTDKTIKITIPGPFTLSQLAVSEYYKTPRDVAMAYADCLNEEIHDLFAAGADVVQFDEPYLQARYDEAKSYGAEAITRAFKGVKGTTALHVCFGYAAMVADKSANGYSCLPLIEGIEVNQVSIEAAQPELDLAAALNSLPSKTIILGVINLGDETPETPELVAERLRKALEIIPPERIIAAPDCGLKYLPRESARGKLKALVEGTRIVNAEL